MSATPAQRIKLGERIVARRKERGWDQQTLARVSGVNAGYLSTIERGIKAPSLSTLHRLRNALGVDDATWLLWLDTLKPSDRAGAA